MTKHKSVKRLAALLTVLCVLCSMCAALASGEASGTAPDGLSHEGYTLEQVVVLSRHNIRAPLSGGGSVLDTLTPYAWFNWSSNPSELSLRGGVLETEMGQYFRKWLEDEGLFPENYQPTDEAVRFYANSKQRTIATANYFASGLLPVADVDVETHMAFDEMDPVFKPQLTFVSDEYRADVEAQIDALFGGDIAALADNYELLSYVIDAERSEAYADGSFEGFVTDDAAYILEVGEEPGMTGSLKTACSVSDALILQYYEADASAAAFGKTLTAAQWEDIAEIKDVYQNVLFTTPLVAANVAHPLLQEIESELNREGRRFTFLCGHDSNIGSVLAALSAEPYDLPDTIEKTTPIGCKLVFSRWVDAGGEAFIAVDLVYQTTAQLQGAALLDLEPAVVSLRFAGMEPNRDGLYPAAEMEERLQSAIAAYDEIMADEGIPAGGDVTVSYLGPAGTYTEEATQFFFGDGVELSPEQTVDDAIAALTDGEADYAVIPQENTLGGAVTGYVDALIAAEDVYVVGEVVLPISQTLMGVPGTALADIETVYSHAQGLTQSAAWRAEYLPDAAAVETDSTAAAASYVAEQRDKSNAAIAAPGAAGLYGLEVLAENVQITDANRTRFYVLSTSAATDTEATRAVFVAQCGADGIDDILAAIHDAGLELVTLHDRPEGSALGSYYYLIEVEDETGVTAGRLDRVSALDGVRYLGSFDTVEK